MSESKTFVSSECSAVESFYEFLATKFFDDRCVFECTLRKTLTDGGTH